MSRNYFATTDETETHYFEDPSPGNPKGVFVTIKLRLGWGERKRLDSAAVTTMSTQQLQAAANGQAVDGAEQEEVARTMTYGLNLFVPNFLKLACYILDWNLPGPNGRPMHLPRNIDERARLMERLDETVGDEIAAFIDGVVERQQKALAAAKEKDEDGESVNGTVLASGSRIIEGHVVDGDENPTPPLAGRSPSSGSRRA
jgi:hypothetical protein